MKTMEFKNNTLYFIDQRDIPTKITYYAASNYHDVIFAIKEMVVRGAPAIGAAACYGVYMAALEAMENPNSFYEFVDDACKELLAARPTAVNLRWAVEQMQQCIKEHKEKGINSIINALALKAERYAREDIETNRSIGRIGNTIVPRKANILTHCNTGSLATVDFGTALGVIRTAHKHGKDIHVYVDETRPRLQGARLTAFELVQEGITATLIIDSVAAVLIQRGKIDLILVGADRIAANGDTANKIGTYMLSELASCYRIPFYIVAPTSTIDTETLNGQEIDIEERGSIEVTHIEGIQIAPQGINVFNPAFDITPAANITGIITEKGIVRPPLAEGIAKLMGKTVE